LQLLEHHNALASEPGFVLRIDYAVDQDGHQDGRCGVITVAAIKISLPSLGVITSLPIPAIIVVRR
jgi:hypothetical protein